MSLGRDPVQKNCQWMSGKLLKLTRFLVNAAHFCSLFYSFYLVGEAILHEEAQWTWIYFNKKRQTSKIPWKNTIFSAVKWNLVSQNNSLRSYLISAKLAVVLFHWTVGQLTRIKDCAQDADMIHYHITQVNKYQSIKWLTRYFLYTWSAWRND